MKLNFRIHYVTEWGQAIQLAVFGQDNKLETYTMECDEAFIWHVQIDFNKHSKLLKYQYQILKQSGEIVPAYGGIRKLNIPEKAEKLYVNDFWRGPYGDGPFNSVVFNDCFFKRRTPEETGIVKKNKLVITLNCPQMEPGRHFAITGNQNILGNWDVSKKLKIDDSGFPLWKIELDTDKIAFPLEYKYLIVDTASDEVLAWGGGPNRVVKSIFPDGVNVVNDEHFLRTIDSWKGAGVAIPVFSLRSKMSFGVGEFSDLKLMVDWAVLTGQKIIQTLPVNDTILYHTNFDSYPYNAVSVNALHPLYLNPEKTGKLPSAERRAYFEEKRKELNNRTFSDYQNVMNLKWEYFREIYPLSKDKIFASGGYKLFFENNKEWLVPYAAFSYLRDLNGTPDFHEWPEYNVYNKVDIEKLSSPQNNNYDEIAIFYFLQYHLYVQLTDVHEYARSKGVAIKGDIPIGVSPRSADAWVNPELFNLNAQAGAPPDDFSPTGQNWGFPTYNWEKMAEDGFEWWKKRFENMAVYFDAYRIDHILGFFRIWEIPENDVWGLTGSFNPSLPFSREELQERGFWMDDDRYLKPYMKEHVLYSIFGKYTDDVIREFLLPDGWQSYKFKPEFDTQKKIEKHFASLGYSFGTKDVVIRDGLYMLHCEVLFVKDIRKPWLYHPRISIHNSNSFRDLPENTRKILDGIYVDYYYHRHNDFWKTEAFRKLPALISSTSMLVCGEDLGMVPDSVPDVMNALEILSLEIQRMPKKSNTEFAMPADAPYLSVCTTSTHDMNPIRAWWEEDSTITQRFYNKALGIPGVAPEICEQWIAEKIVEQHLQSKAMWVILPWQDWISTEKRLWLKHPVAERINVPSNPRNFWCYRIHIPLEKLIKDHKFNQKIRKMIEDAGR